MIAAVNSYSEGLDTSTYKEDSAAWSVARINVWSEQLSMLGHVYFEPLFVIIRFSLILS